MKRIAVVIALSLLVFGGRASADDTLWLRIHGANTTEAGTAVAAIGPDIYVAGTVASNSGILLVKYHSNGDSVWSRVLNLNPTAKTVGIAVGSDSAPVVCVADTGGLRMLSLVKFDKHGDTLWTRNHVGFAPTGVALGSSNAVFVYGSSGVPLANESLCLAKYSAGGVSLFYHDWRLGPSHTTGGCAADGNGNIIGAVTASVPTLLKFDSLGDTLWSRQYPDLSGGELQGVAVEPNGCVVIGDLRDTTLHIVKFGAGGSELWDESLPGYGATRLYANIAVDADSDVLAPVTDYRRLGGLVVLNARGQQVWFGGSGRPCLLKAIAVDAGGLPVVAGRSNVAPPGCVTVKFSPSLAIAEPVSPLIPRAGRFLVTDIIGPGQAIALSVPRAGSYTISILTENGALLRQINAGYVTPGEFRFSPGKLAAGSYYLSIAGPAGTSQEKFILLR